MSTPRLTSSWSRRAPARHGSRKLAARRPEAESNGWTNRLTLAGPLALVVAVLAALVSSCSHEFADRERASANLFAGSWRLADETTAVPEGSPSSCISTLTIRLAEDGTAGSFTWCEMPFSAQVGDVMSATVADTDQHERLVHCLIAWPELPKRPGMTSGLWIFEASQEANTGADQLVVKFDPPRPELSTGYMSLPMVKYVRAP